MRACLQVVGKLHLGALRAVNSVTNGLLALNSAVNFAIYCLVGRKFRRILRRRILRCGKSDDTTTPAAPEPFAPAPAAPNVDGGSRAAVRATETVRRLIDAATECSKDGVSHSGNHVVVVVVSAAEVAGTAEEELTALPVDADYIRRAST